MCVLVTYAGSRRRSLDLALKNPGNHIVVPQHISTLLLLLLLLLQLKKSYGKRNP